MGPTPWKAPMQPSDAMPSSPLDGRGATADSRPGLRLHRVEVLNWGTFDQKVAVLEVGGGNCLLTGQVGAGKSTIVDAVSLVMNPPSQITFNQAAGASRRERSLTSYVLGAYRNVSDEQTGTSRPDHLRRAAGAQSVVLTVYGDDAGRRIAIGVMLRFQNEASTPKAQYVVADRDLSIEHDFTGHADARGLRAALRSAGVEIFDNYTQYSKVLERRLHLTRVALGLFNQTVSMKSVADLNEFVRRHMLEPIDVAPAVDKMLSHYADLTRAHDLVVDAREQREWLDKVEVQSRALDAAEARIAAAEAAVVAVASEVDAHRRVLLDAAIDAAAAQVPVLESRTRSLDARLESLRRQQTDLEVGLRAQGGSDLALAERDPDAAPARLEAVAEGRRRFELLAETALLAPPVGGEDFAQFLAALADAERDVAERGAAASTRLAEAVGARTLAAEALAANEKEAAAAGTRASNMPVRLAELRDRIASELGLGADALVFAGELLDVAAEHTAWRGAIERLTRGFATSLLIPSDAHAAVSRWVEQHHLGQRLVMYRIDDSAVSPPGPSESGTVAARLVVKPGALAAPWVRAEVARRFDHVCVDDVDELARHRRALTRAGQIKDSHRQEKDDRQRIDDTLTWVLGWDTRARIAALRAAHDELVAGVAAADVALQRAQADAGALTVRDRALSTLRTQFADPALIDLEAASAQAQAAQAHVDQLRADPGIAALSAQLEGVVHQLAAAGAEQSAAIGELATTRQDLERYSRERDSLRPSDTRVDPAAREVLDKARAAAGAAPAELSGVEGWGRALREQVDSVAAAARSKRSGVEQALVSAMGAYASRWPARVVDLDIARVTGRAELLGLRARLIADDLPRFERDFRDKLQSNAINEIAMFARKLDTEAGAIGERIATINAALAGIDYQPGTRIELAIEPTKDQQVRDFRGELKAITSGMVGAGDGAYNEEKFLAVRDLLDRFRGREGRADDDARWVRRVTDVRNWHTFAANERSREEDTLVEHYSDSDGKSGGQKEKLAYTILAASLAYQYGLADGDARSFRFVMIDEAFGRGSEESTRYGLDLFDRLGLQLLVVTPLQKISTIEPHVQAVGYIGRTGTTSRLRSMTIEEYRALRASRAADDVRAALAVP